MLVEHNTVTLPSMSEEEYKQWGIYSDKHYVSMRDEPAEHLRRFAVMFISHLRRGVNLNNSLSN